jgi:alpha-amylase
MVVDVALYTLVHQPRRVKLPAQPIPHYASIEDITRCLFDERLNEYSFRQVAQSSYYPAARVLLELVREQGLRLALGFSLSFIRQAERWEPALLTLFRELAQEEAVELICADPYHSLHCLLDLPAFALRMSWMADEMEMLFGKRPTVTDTTEMCMSASIYDALDAAGFRGAFIDGDPRVLQWRSSNYLYRYSDEQPGPFDRKPPARARRTAKSAARARQGPPYTSEAVNENGLLLLSRHQGLSSDVSQRFSHHAWSSYPLYADAYAGWIAQAAGDFVLLNWDFETLGERHAYATGIFEFMQALPGELERHGVSMRTPSELIERYAAQRIYHLPLPLHPPSWAEMFGLDAGAGYGPQRELFQLLRDTYDRARLTENAELVDLALWLAQADNFRLLQGFGNQYATVGTPQEWWRLGPHEMLNEQKRVYLNLLGALEPHLPARLLRLARHKLTVPVRPARRKSVGEKTKAASPASQK